jgi:autotransporter-associated beta strand protein
LGLLGRVSVFAVLAPGLAAAATGTWTGTNGATWGISATNWTTVTGTPWDSGNGGTNIANFTNTSGAATVSGTVYANQLTYTAASGSFSINGGTINLAGTTPTISVNTNRTLTIGSTLDGSSGPVKANTGVLSLSGNNTYTGTTTIGAGTLRISSASALGDSGAGNGTTISTGGDLSLTGNITVASEALTHNGGTGGFLRNVSGTNVWNGGITIGAANSRIRSDAGLLTIGGNIAMNANTIFEGAADTTVTGLISGSAALQLGGNNSGTVTLNGLNTYTGQTTVNRGTLSVNTMKNYGVDSSIGKGTNTQQIILGGGTTDGTLLYTGTGDTSDRRFRIGSSTTAAETGGAVIKNDGSGALVFNAATFNQVSTNVTVNRTLTLGGTNTGANTISGVIANNTNTVGLVGVTKVDSGTWILSGANTYSGATIVGGGTLRIDSNVRLGNTTNTVTLSNAGVLEVTAAGTLTNAITVGAGNGSLFNSSSGSLVVAGAVSKNGTVFTSRSISGTNVFTGVISGASANSDFVVDGGTTVFSNVMTYNGPTIITNGGTLVLGVDDAMPSGSSLVLGGGTFRIGVENYNADASLSLGTLTLTANSTIDLGGYGTSGDRNLVFANSSSITWATNAVLTITNWQGAAQAQSDVTKLLFGTGGLTSTQLGQIYFANQDVGGGVLLGAQGELAPIPEARIIWAAIGLVLFIVWRERSRFRQVLLSFGSAKRRADKCPLG